MEVKTGYLGVTGIDDPEVKPFEFNVSVFEAGEKFNEVITKGRVRLFYEGLNRNSGFITSEFAAKLLSTIPYTPIKGIYEYDDFTDHGTTRAVSKVYGVVPENPNISWEYHLDEDGVNRLYACADALLWTSIYEEANDIVGKGQSMELYVPSIKGEWRPYEGKRAYFYTDGCFLGLQVLGDSIEPCFEGAAFFTLFQSLKEALTIINDFSLSRSGGEGKDKMGGTKMEINFKLSDREKYDLLFQAVNPNYNDEGGYEVQYSILDVFDTYFLAYNYEDRLYYRFSYTVDPDTKAVSLGDPDRRWIIDVGAVEKNFLESTGFGDLFSNLEVTIDKIKNDIAAFDALKGSLTEKETELLTLKDTCATEVSTLNGLVETLTNEKNVLESYRAAQEASKKEVLLASYSELLSSEVIEKLSKPERLVNFSVEDLEKELSYELVKSNKELFTRKPQTLIPSDEGNQTPLEALLDKYRK